MGIKFFFKLNFIFNMDIKVKINIRFIDLEYILLVIMKSWYTLQLAYDNWENT